MTVIIMLRAVFQHVPGVHAIVTLSRACDRTRDGPQYQTECRVGWTLTRVSINAINVRRARVTSPE